jgi:hypothetical protein
MQEGEKQRILDEAARFARERGDEVSRSVDLKIKEAMDQIEKEEKIKSA